MAKVKSAGNANKVSFGKRRKGKATKRKGPKDKNRSIYIGQGK